jgi:hypothetical protein
VPEAKTAKNRMHIDVRVAGDRPERERLIRARVTILEAAGATFVRNQTYDGKFAHTVMLDPEGNEFCVA